MRSFTHSIIHFISVKAQNTTREQMKDVLTRMGFNSEVVVTGITQIDLPGAGSGAEAKRVLSGVEGVGIKAT